MSGSDGCCDCLYDDVSVECIVATNCRSNRVLIKSICLSVGSQFHFQCISVGLEAGCNLGID